MTSPGYRPNSGRQSSLSVQGEPMNSEPTLQHPKRSYKYRKVASSGNVDETLFTSKRYEYLQSLNSSSNARPTSAADWFTHDESNQSPSDNRTVNTPPIKSPLIKVGGAPRTRSRAYKPIPTYVDETLFGPKLKDSKFPAPWEKPEDEKKGPMLTWSPPVRGSLSCTPRSTPPSRPSSSAGSRPGSAKGTRPGSAGGSRPGSAEGSRPGSASRGRTGSRPATPNKPVWK